MNEYKAGLTKCLHTLVWRTVYDAGFEFRRYSDRKPGVMVASDFTICIFLYTDEGGAKEATEPLCQEVESTLRVCTFY